ncbi:cyclic lactone autoinducer peptide [Anoxybacterium hadale]|uniref:Cyclic lactone autoinducer peptide n=1 Tax=Anoxybacterium hadale TaxID=3408580 RepID=A0ACD1AAL9_9FIRM|nr:cyclic lactone autoinducer peptide [Clostridiales bacterium]
MKNLMVKFSGMIAALALLVTATNVGITCMAWAHQPELPKGAEKLRKF